MIRDVVVEGFDVGALEVCEVTGVDDGGRVDEAVELGGVDFGGDAEVVDAGAVVDPLDVTDVCELAGGLDVGNETGPEVVTTEGVAVTGTSPLLVGSAAGSDEQPDSTSTAPTSAPTARPLNSFMNLPDPPTEQPLTTPV